MSVKMFRNLRHLFHCTRATVAVETAIFVPIFLVMTLGIADLGAGMFVRMQGNAAVQAGAAYAVINSCASSCITGIEAAMNDATGNPSFCTGSVCAASMSPSTCTAGSVCVITVSANYPFSPILPNAAYSWTKSMTVSSTAKVRIQ
jgi:Flp pilus assembly protein TadG